MEQTRLGCGDREAYHGAEVGSHNTMLVQSGHNTDEVFDAGSDTPNCLCWIEEDGNHRRHRYYPGFSRVSDFLLLSHFPVRVCTVLRSSYASP